MNKKYTDYTMEELTQYAKEAFREFDLAQECGRNPRVWGTLNGDRIPVWRLTDNHLDNIIIHLKERDATTGWGWEMIMDEKKRRLAEQTNMGKVLYEEHKKSDKN